MNNVTHFLGGILVGALLMAVALTCMQPQALKRFNDSGEPTVLITNAGIDPLAIHLAGEIVRRGWLQPGETRCLVLRQLPVIEHQLLARAGGKLLALSPQVDLRSAQGWRWIVEANLPTPWLAGQNLVPIERCKP